MMDFEKPGANAPGFLFVGMDRLPPCSAADLALHPDLPYCEIAGLSGIRSQGGVEVPTGGKGGSPKPASAIP
jgi:hypothetical protein